MPGLAAGQAGYGGGDLLVLRSVTRLPHEIAHYRITIYKLRLTWTLLFRAAQAVPPRRGAAVRAGFRGAGRPGRARGWRGRWGNSYRSDGIYRHGSLSDETWRSGRQQPRHLPMCFSPELAKESSHERTATALQRLHLAERVSRVRVARSRRRCPRRSRAGLLRRHRPDRRTRPDGFDLPGRQHRYRRVPGHAPPADAIRPGLGALGRGLRHQPHRADRDGLDDLQQAVGARPPVCHAGSSQRWPRWLEHRHHRHAAGRGELRRARPS